MFWIYNGFHPIFTYIPFKVWMFSPSINLMSCSLLIPWLCSLRCLSNGDVIYGISSLCSLGCLSYGDVICGTIVVYLTTCTIHGIALNIVGTTNGSIIPFIIFYALKSMLSCSLFIPELKAPLSSTLFFLLKTLIGKPIAILFLIFSVVCISSLVLSTLADGFCGLSF